MLPITCLSSRLGVLDSLKVICMMAQVRPNEGCPIDARRAWSTHLASSSATPSYGAIHFSAKASNLQIWFPYSFDSLLKWAVLR